MTDEPETPNRCPKVDDNRSENQSSKTHSQSQLKSSDRNRVYDALADCRRRYVLHCLKTARTPMALADLADEIVRWETDTAPTEVQAERERIYTSLYHRHLPKLADADLISFDVTDKRVSLHADTADVPLQCIEQVQEKIHRDTTDTSREE
jgi:hypothetical protein